MSLKCSTGQGGAEPTLSLPSCLMPETGEWWLGKASKKRIFYSLTLHSRVGGWRKKAIRDYFFLQVYICVLGIFINVHFCIFALSYFFQLGLRALADSGDVSVEAGLRTVRQHWRQLILPRRRSTMPGLPPPPFIFQLKVYCPSCLLGLIFKVEVFLLFPLFSYGLSIKLKVGSTSFPRILTHLGEKKSKIVFQWREMT